MGQTAGPALLGREAGGSDCGTDCATGSAGERGRRVRLRDRPCWGESEAGQTAGQTARPALLGRETGGSDCGSDCGTGPAGERGGGSDCGSDYWRVDRLRDRPCWGESITLTSKDRVADTIPPLPPPPSIAT